MGRKKARSIARRSVAGNGWRQSIKEVRQKMPRAEKACRIAFRNAAAKGVERGEWQESALYGKARGSAGKVAFIFFRFS